MKEIKKKILTSSGAYLLTAMVCITFVGIKTCAASDRQEWQELSSLSRKMAIGGGKLATEGSFIHTYISKDSTAFQTSADTVSQKKNIWIFGTTYGNNSSFLGRYQAERLPYLAADITFKSGKGIWLSAMAYQITSTADFVDEVDLMAGWDFALSKRIDASLSYSHYFFSPSSPLLKATAANALSSYIGLDWRYLYSRLSTAYIFGHTSDFFLILDNSRYFEFAKLLHKEDYLSIEPKLSLIAGTQTFVESHLTDRQMIPGISPVTGPSTGKGRTGSGGGTTTASSGTTNKAFTVLSYEACIPVTYAFKKFSFETAFRYTIPVNLLEGDTIGNQFFITTSLIYTIY